MLCRPFLIMAREIIFLNGCCGIGWSFLCKLYKKYPKLDIKRVPTISNINIIHKYNLNSSYINGNGGLLIDGKLYTEKQIDELPL